MKISYLSPHRQVISPHRQLLPRQFGVWNYWLTCAAGNRSPVIIIGFYKHKVSFLSSKIRKPVHPCGRKPQKGLALRTHLSSSVERCTFLSKTTTYAGTNKDEEVLSKLEGRLRIDGLNFVQAIAPYAEGVGVSRKVILQVRLTQNSSKSMCFPWIVGCKFHRWSSRSRQLNPRPP